MTNAFTLNLDQQLALELLQKNCKKVELYLNNDEQKTAMCLLEDQKVIEVTFYSEDKLCVDFFHHEDDVHCQECLRNYELSEARLERYFEEASNNTDHLQYINSKSHAQRILDFLKNS